MSEHVETQGQDAPESAIRRATKLLERAAHEATGAEEAATCREQADAIMRKYRIDRARLEFSKNEVEREQATHEEWEVPSDIPGSNFREMMRSVAELAGLRYRDGSRREQGTYRIVYTLTVVGFRDDITFGTLLWASIFREFATRVNPSWSTDRTFDANVKVLKDAGFSWPDIAAAANRHGFEGGKADGKWKAAYQRQCKLEGVEPTKHTQRSRAFRVSFAEAFCSTIENRIYQMRYQAQQEKKAAATADTSLLPALANEKQSIDDLYYELFPDEHPDKVAERRAAARARIDADVAAEARRRAGLTEAQRRKEDEEQRKQAERDERAYQAWVRRMGGRTPQRDYDGWGAGTAAGKAVDLSGGKHGNRVGNEGQREIG